MIFKGIGTSIAKKPYIFVIFQRRGVQTLCPPSGSAHGGEPDQTPRFAVSDLGLHCFHMSHKKDTRLI